MADPISITIAMVTLVPLAVTACQSLRDAIQSFQNFPLSVIELLRETESLQAIFTSLRSLVAESEPDLEPDLEMLRAPVLGCSEACRELAATITKCMRHSGQSTGSRTSVRDWMMFKIEDKEINRKRNMLAHYKATIEVVMGYIH